MSYKPKTGVFSKNGTYFISSDDDYTLYIFNINQDVYTNEFGISIKRVSNRSFNASVFFPNTPGVYYGYQYPTKFATPDMNDCICMSESLCTFQVINENVNAEFLKDKKSDKVFGRKDIENRRIALASNYGPTEQPDVNEAYVIVRTILPRNKQEEYAPFHVALVFAKDGTCDITIEAFAGVDIQRPIFRIYDPYDNVYKLSFYDTWKETFGGESNSKFLILIKRSYDEFSPKEKQNLEMCNINPRYLQKYKEE